MKLEALLKAGNVKGVKDDSRRVAPGDVFISFPVPEAESFVKAAVAAGAVAIVSEADKPEGLDVEWLKVQNAAEARLELAQKFYGEPFKSLRVHAVTGTNGKTTSAFLMREILAAAGKKVALLGTICNRILDEKLPSALTTPGLLDLHAFARKALDAGATELVMEASSHALLQGRVAGIRFASALFSNLTQDHLDYHKTMENYFEAKKLLFTKYLAADGLAVLNIDDVHGKLLAETLSCRKLLVSRLMSPLADLKPSKAPDVHESGIEVLLPEISAEPFRTALCGEFNVDNVLLVLGWAKGLGLPEQAMRSALASVKVPGRFEKVYDANGRHVIVDYAHTPDALERVLKTARRLCQGKLSVVFGCGGDRDKKKRPLMGAIAEENADVAWVTSDNPRTEVPEEILKDIEAGMRLPHKVEVDRAKAIFAAVKSLGAGDWLVVAGKGHEDYQIVGKVKHHFDDSEEVLKAVNS